tara:strand:- start:1586 stop:1870 length:285 start_codon:yes stop_codon:yes gene_type:complete
MKNIIIETIIIGFITSILGGIFLRVILSFFNKKDKNEYLNVLINKYSNNYIIEISLFLTGVFLHLLLEYFNVNKWYCEKKCIGDICKIVCEKKI